MQVIVILLTLLVACAIAFAIAFTIVSIYIARRRRVAPKHHFTGVSDMRASPTSDMDMGGQPDTVDRENAKREWERKNFTS